MGEKIKFITRLTEEKFSFASTRLRPLCLLIYAISLFGFSHSVFADDICDRTSSIKNAIVAAIDGVSDCNDVTPANLEEVLSLDLSNSSLTSLDVDDFEGLVRLKTLDLSDNDLEELPTGLFNHAHLPLLHTLYLHNNDLTSYDTLEEAVFLETLTIYGNPAVSEELFDDLHRFYNLNPTATSATSSVYGLPLLKKFLKDNEVATVEDFISALPPLYKERFSMVFDSEGLGADSISGSYPRVISHGADADLLFAWLTDPNAEEQFKKSVEFLLQTQNSNKWTAGVIDFSGDSPVIKHPDSCSSCHGSLNKPLWGNHGVPNNNKPSGKGTEHHSRSDSTVYRQLEALIESSNSRIEPLDFSQAEITVNKMRAYEDSDIAVARELAQIISWSQIKVLFNILKAKPNYKSLEQQILCATGGNIRDEINSIFSTADRHPAYLSHTLEAIQAGDISTDKYDYNNYSMMEESLGMLILYDLWERDSEFRDVYRTLSNKDMVFSEGSIPTSIHDRHLMFKSSDTITARDELLQALRLFFGHANRLSLKERTDRRGPENKQISLHLAQVRPMAQKACTVLEEKGPFTVALEEAPNRHDTNGFTVSIVFSRKLPYGADFSSITATNASILNVTQGYEEGTGNVITKTENTRWEISLDPSSKSDGVTIVLASGSSCDDTICTADDTPLSKRLEIFVRGTKDPPTITSPSEFSVLEGETDVGAVTAIDDETSVDQLTWSISSGADQSHFTLSSDGALSFNSAKDFESPDDSDTDRTYELTVQVTDGSFSTTADLNITLQNVNEIPTITSPSEFSVLEAETAIAKLTATDPDTSLNQLIWSILSGADRSHFTLSSSGALSFNSAKDFESPDDFDTDGDYKLTVRVSDGSLFTTANLNITLQNINEIPIVNAGEDQLNVEEGTVVTLTGRGEDPENTTLSYAWAQTEGLNVALSNQNTANASFTAPSVTEDTTLRFSLTVTDAEGLSGTDYVSVQVVVPSPEDELVDGDLRLVNGEHDLEGRVEIYHDEKWGTVCDDFWNTRSAKVVCRQLGHTGGKAFSRAHFGQGSDLIWLDNVRCDGDEDRLEDCIANDWGSHNCRHSEDAGVSCTQAVGTAPTFTEGDSATRSVAENTDSGTAIGSAVSATDANNDTLTYSLGGTNASSFSINSSTGQLSTSAELNYELKNSYSVTVSVSDGNGGSDTISVTINVTNVEEDDEDSLAAGFENMPSSHDGSSQFTFNVRFSEDVAIGFANMRNHAFDVTNGDVKVAQRINRSSAHWRITVEPDDNSDVIIVLEANRACNVTGAICTSDGDRLSTRLTATVSGPNSISTNQAPTFTEGARATRSIAENTASGTALGSAISATDGDNHTLTYTLGGPDASSFSINSGTGQLSTFTTLDFETKNSYSVTVSVSDGNGGSDSISVTINVTNVNEAPVFTEDTSTTRSVAENTASGTVIGSAISATDEDSGNTLIYTLGGTNANSFRINSSTGQLNTSAALDYETKNSYSVTVSVSDGNGGNDSIFVMINVTDANDAPVFTESTSATRSVAENTFFGRAIGSAVSATDEDNDALTYSLGGTDASSFSIDSSTGQLSTSANLDFETKNSYSLTVGVSDSNGGSDSISVTINITDVVGTGEHSDGDLRLVKGRNGSNELEGRVEIYHDGKWGTVCDDNWSASDAKVVCRQLGHTGGTAFSRAEFGEGNGTIWMDEVGCSGSESKLKDCTFNNGGWGDHDCQHAEDASVSCIDINNQAPVFTEGESATRSIAENTDSGTAIGSAVSATDGDNDTLTYTLGGPDASSFSIDSSTGQLSTSAALDFETKNSYSVTLSVSDSNGGSDSIAVTINVTNANDAPSFTEGTSTTRSVAENTASGTNIGSAVSATDEDNDTLTYTLGGPDASSFSIDSSTGQLSTSAALDYETKHSYSVTVSVSDSNGGSDSISVIINVTNVAEGDEIILTARFQNMPSSHDGSSQFTFFVIFNEDVAISVANMRDDAFDVTNGDITNVQQIGGSKAHWKITADPEGDADMTIVLEAHRVCSTVGAICTSNGDRLSTRLTATVSSVVSTNQAPVFTEETSATRSIAENADYGTAIGSAVSATDGDNDTLTYTLSGTDASSFSIDSGTGQLSTSAALDFETKNYYSVTVSVSDGNEGSDSITVTINVTNVEIEPAPNKVVQTPWHLSNVTITFPEAPTDIESYCLTMSISGTIPSQKFYIAPFANYINDVQFYAGLQTHIDGKADKNNPVLVTRGKGGIFSRWEENHLDAIMQADGGLFENSDHEGNFIGVRNDFQWGVGSYRLCLRKGAVVEGDPLPSGTPPSNAWGTYVHTWVRMEITDLSTNETSFMGGLAFPGNSLSLSRTNGIFVEFYESINTQDVSAMDIVFNNFLIDGEKVRYSEVSDESNPKDRNSNDPKMAYVSYDSQTQDVSMKIGEFKDEHGQITTTHTVDPNITLSSDVPIFSVSAESDSVSEGSSADFVIERSGDTSTSQTVAYEIQDTEDTLVSSSTSGSVTFSSSETSKTVSLATQNDAVDESNGVVTLTLKENSAYEISGSRSAEVTVQDVNSLTAEFENMPSSHDGSSLFTFNVRFSEDVAISYVNMRDDAFDITNGDVDRAQRVNGSSAHWRITVEPDDNRDVIIVLEANRDCNTVEAICTSDEKRLSTRLEDTVSGPVVSINQAPVFTEGTSATRSIAENTDSGTAIGSAVSATDGDNDTLTYSLSGTNASSFSINSGTGQLSTSAALDFETKNSYSVTVSVSDSNGGSDSIAVTINVTDVDENVAPSFTEGTSTTRSVAENTASGTNIGSAISATDGDNDALTYTLGGPDASSFSIDSSTGQLSTSAALDFETKNSYSVTVSVSDSNGGSDSISVTINVTNVDEGGEDSLTASFENMPSSHDGSSLFTFNVRFSEDVAIGFANMRDHAFDVTNGDVELAQRINGSSARWRITVEPDGDDDVIIVLGANRDCNVAGAICTSEGTRLSTHLTATVSGPDNTNEDPTFTEGTSATRSIAENTASNTNIGSAVSATDGDNDTLTYSLGGTNRNSFSINSGTGQLRTSAALDFETKNRYFVTVSVSDSNGGSDSISVTINVTDVNENVAPSFTEGTSTTRSIAENTASNTNIGSVVSATDGDNDTLTYSLGGTNASSFSINSGTGQLRTSAALDFETKNNYSVTVSVSDSNGGSDSISVTINVTDVEEEDEEEEEEEEVVDPSEGDLRLVGGNNNLEGRVEVYHDEQWGTVCDDFWSFDKDNPKVVCRQLGHKGGTAYGGAHFGEGSDSDPIWMDNVRCSGNESKLKDCNFNGWGVSDCDHSEDVGVKCSSSASSFAHTNMFVTSHGLNNGGSFGGNQNTQGIDPNSPTPITQLIDGALQGRHPSELEVLDLTDRKLPNLNGIEELTGLRQLFLGGNLISDLYPLSGLTELRYLDLSDNEITDLSQLYGLQKLERLNLSYNNIEDLSPLVGLTNLEVLLINRNKVADIGILFYLNKLTYLGLAHNEIEDITALSHLFELDVLDLEGNRITDLSPLSHMTELRYLDLSDNHILDINHLAYLFNLEALDLDYNQVSDPQVLSNLSSLMTLFLRSNQLKDIGSLHHIDNLQNLDVRDHAIDTSPVLWPDLIWLGTDRNKVKASAQTHH